jgi:predicted ArsR family transcriptional regulator
MQINDKKLALMVRKLKSPRTVDELADLVGVSRRTVFRWLTVLSESGHEVQRVNISRPTKYQIS